MWKSSAEFNNMALERPEPLSGKDEGSFAYLTIRDRMAVILTKVIDGVHRRASSFVKENNKEMAEDAKGVISRLSKMRYELKTGKKLTGIEDNKNDVILWNDSIKSAKSLVDGGDIAWFTGAWLTCECFMYRKIYEACALSEHHQEYDTFRGQKQDSFTTLHQSITSLAHHLADSLESASQSSDLASLKLHFDTLIQFSLWGNKCDLSVSSGELLYNQTVDLASQLQHMKEKILVDDSNQVWQQLKNTDNTRIDFVLDNAGFELFTDLCLAEYLLHIEKATVVHIHVKDIPWFVSDTTEHDLHWTLQQMRESSDVVLSGLGQKWLRRIEEGSFVIRRHLYWTLPKDYSEMKSCAGDLYEDLSSSKLIFFKGDLNYRKLVGDRKWPHTTPYAKALWGFCPAPLCALRTLKANVIVGLAIGQDNTIEAVEKDWMTNGSHGVIQFTHHL